MRSQREHSDRRGKLARVGVHCRFEGGATKVVRAFAGTDLTAAARHGSPSSSSADSLLRVSGGRLEAAARNLVSCAAISFEALPASSRCSVKAAMRGGRPLPRSAPQAAETSTCMLFSRAHHSTMHKPSQVKSSQTKLKCVKINSASSQSVSQSGSSRAHHTVSGDGSTPLGLNTNTEYLLARATQDLKFTVAASATPCRDRCAVTCVRRWYRYSVLEWGLVVAEGVSEAAGAYTRSIIRGSTRGTRSVHVLLVLLELRLRRAVPTLHATDYSCARCVVSFSEPRELEP